MPLNIKALGSTAKSLFLTCLFVTHSPAFADCKPSDPLVDAIASGHRTAEYASRDAYRHPEETLRWFDVQPTMTVVEIWPGGGWYSEILAPYLSERGTYYAAGFDPKSEIPFYRLNALKLQDKFLSNPDIYGQAKITILQPPSHIEIAPAGSADRVLTFRNVHNWMKTGNANQVFTAMYRALKPGGILGVVEHRAPANSIQDERAVSGYVTEAYVIQLAAQAGFLLAGRSEINANPKDTKDYPEGVWTLPPSLRLKDENMPKYLAIGESDRMTLKFMKPYSTRQLPFSQKE